MLDFMQMIGSLVDMNLLLAIDMSIQVMLQIKMSSFHIIDGVEDMMHLANIGVIEQSVQDFIVSNFSLAQVNRIVSAVMMCVLVEVLLNMISCWSSQARQDRQVS